MPHTGPVPARQEGRKMELCIWTSTEHRATQQGQECWQGATMFCASCQTSPTQKGTTRNTQFSAVTQDWATKFTSRRVHSVIRGQTWGICWQLKALQFLAHLFFWVSSVLTRFSRENKNKITEIIKWGWATAPFWEHQQFPKKPCHHFPRWKH